MIYIAKQQCKLAIAACCLLVSGLVLSQSAPQSKIEAPSNKVGDSWTFDRTDGLKNVKEYSSAVVVTAVSDSEIRTSATRSDNGNVATTIRNKELNRLSTETAIGKNVADPYYPSFAFPLEIGKTWEKEVTSTRSNEPDWKVVTSLKGRVVGWEKVTVPAGSFNALKIEVLGSYNGWKGSDSRAGKWSGQSIDTAWYVPEVKNIVKSVYEESGLYMYASKVILELVEYKLIQ